MSHPTPPGPPSYSGGSGPAYTAPPRRRRTGQVVLLVVLSVVAVLGFCAAGVLFLTGDGDPSPADPTKTAETQAAEDPLTDPGESGLVALGDQYAEAINSADKAAAVALTCEQEDAGSLYELIVGDGTEYAAEQPRVTAGDTYGTLTITDPEGAGPFTLSGDYEDGRWCTNL